MAFKHGRSAKVLIDQYDMSSYLTDNSVSASADLPTSTTYGNSGVRRQVVGLKDGQITMSSQHDTTAGGSHAVFTAALGAATANIVTSAPEGLALSSPVKMLQAREADYSPSAPVDGIVAGEVTFEGDGGVDFGVSLHTLTAETTTGNSSSHDGSAATTNGGVAHIHCTAASGSTPTNTVKVQHSTDNSTWADLVTFTQLAAAGTERSEVAAGTTVNRYLRETHTIGGSSPSFTYAVAFARR